MASSSTYGNDIVGRRVEVLWERDSTNAVANTGSLNNIADGVGWYSGIISKYNISKQEHLIEYDDGDQDWYDLGKVQFRLILDSAIGDESQSESPTKTSQIFLNVGSTVNKSIHDTSTIRSVGDETYDSNDMNVIGDEAEDVLNVSNNKASNDNNAIDGNDGSDGNSKRRSQMLSPTSKMVEALQYTKSIEESSIANASGLTKSPFLRESFKDLRSISFRLPFFNFLIM